MNRPFNNKNLMSSVFIIEFDVYGLLCLVFVGLGLVMSSVFLCLGFFMSRLVISSLLNVKHC